MKQSSKSLINWSHHIFYHLRKDIESKLNRSLKEMLQQKKMSNANQEKEMGKV
jgi:hypothetical protein